MPEKIQKTGCLDGFTLKMVMLFLMTLDHLYYGLFPDTLLWGHIAARVVAPVFAYLVTEGMVYTHNRARYIGRIFLFGLIMFAGNTVLYGIYGRWIDNSILLALAIGAALIAGIDCAKQARGGKRFAWILASIALFAMSMVGEILRIWLYTQNKTVGIWVQMICIEGSYMIPVMLLIFYYLRRHQVMMWLVYALTFCTPYLVDYLQSGGLQPQFWMILAIVPIVLYNGKRGWSSKLSKYIFYIYYPLHIWIIYLIEQYRYYQ